MKRILSAFFAVLFLLCLGGCSTDPTDTGAPGTTPAATAPSTTAPKDRDPQLGRFADGVYTNEFLGIRCRVDEKWYVYSDTEMAQLNGLVLDTMTDADLVEQLKKANVAHLFYAAANEGLTTVNVALENIGMVNGVLLDEQTYVELSAEQLPAALQSMGLQNVKAETASFSFAGSRHAGVKVSGSLSGVPFYERIVCIKLGSYIGVVTVASYHEDMTPELLKMFSAI